MSNHLKPCPFCGGDASFNDHTDGCYFTVLRKLKADPPADLSRVPDLIEAWNTRTAIQQATQPAEVTDAEIDALCLSLTGFMTRKERDRAVARAILALRPAQVPMTEGQIRSMCKQGWVFETVKQWVSVIEAHHGIKPKEQA